MTIQYEHCDALIFKDEFEEMCCSEGKIHLENLTIPPEPLLYFLDGNSAESKYAFHQIRNYNCFSFGDNDPTIPSWKTTCKIRAKQFLQVCFMKNYQEQAEV